MIHTAVVRFEPNEAECERCGEVGPVMITTHMTEPCIHVLCPKCVIQDHAVPLVKDLQTDISIGVN